MYGFVIMRSPVAYVPMPRTFGSTTQSYASTYAAQNQSVSARGETSSSMATLERIMSRVMWWL